MQRLTTLLFLSFVLAFAGGCASQPAAQPAQPPEPTTPPQPTATEKPAAEPTNTSPPEPTATQESTAEPTQTPSPEPTATEEPTVEPTNTPEPTEEVVVVDPEQARALIERGNCQICHMASGIDFMTGQTGPNWCVPATKVQSGEEDLAYIRESILQPNAVIAEGYFADIMPQNFGETFTDEQIDVLVNFIAGLECE